MRTAVLRTLVVLLVLGGVLLACAPLLSGGPAAEPAAEGAWTQARIDDWLNGSRAAMLTLAIAKGLPILLGIVFLVQEILRADRERAGRLTPGLSGPPTLVSSATQALGLTVFCFLGVQIVAATLLKQWDGDRPVTPAAQIERGVVIAFASLMPLALLTVLRRRRLSGGALPSVGVGLAEGVRYACLALLLVMPVSLLWALGLQARGVPLEVQSLVQKFAQPDSASQPWLVAVFGAFVAPFTEEAVFRGLLYPSLRRALPGGPFAAAVLVSLLFAAIHGSLLAFLPLFLLAMVLAGVMERTNSLLACYVVHALHNATSLAPMIVRMLEGPAS